MSPTVDGEYVDPNQVGEGPLTEEQRLYKENILDHYRNPRNKGRTDRYDLHGKDKNPFCGDVIEVFLTVEDGTVTGVSWEGEGCAISQASMSMLSKRLKGKTADEVGGLDPDDVLGMLGIPIGIVRRKCAMLGLRVVQKVVRNEA